VPVWNAALQVDPQSMPAGVEVTEPLPVILTVRVFVGTAEKVAVTVLLVSMTTVHVPVSVHAPDHPANV
jgi:hypothetical protein